MWSQERLYEKDTRLIFNEGVIHLYTETSWWGRVVTFQIIVRSSLKLSRRKQPVTNYWFISKRGERH